MSPLTLVKRINQKYKLRNELHKKNTKAASDKAAAVAVDDAASGNKSASVEKEFISHLSSFICCLFYLTPGERKCTQQSARYRKTKRQTR